MVRLFELIFFPFFLGEGNIEEAIKQGFLALDDQMRQDDEMREDMSGTTAVVVLIKDKKIYCGSFFLFDFA